jgi:pyridinium-3,5-bisthiocarboxylic acid mononucleotide nickel chelatase
MRVLHFDSTGGASGDMILAALLDAGADPERLRAQLAPIVPGYFALEVSQVQAHGLHGTRVTVQVADADHPHRGLREVAAILHAAPLAPPIRAQALAVFTRLAEAEARVHGVTPDAVHFHEVGAMDAIVDVVGACLALASLDVAQVTVGPLPLGTGTTRSAHGVIPVPVPATLELLRGRPVIQTDEPFELVTPTGAALLSTWAQGDRPAPGLAPARTGHGFGHRTLRARPNLLRARILEPAPAAAAPGDCLVLACEIDDASPEWLGALLDRLPAAGALDAYWTPAQMKKGRPGTLLTVLCTEERRDAVLDLIFRETTTFGVREHAVRRTILDRRHIEVDTPYGRVRVKIGSRGGVAITFAPEYEDCARQALAHGVAVREVHQAAMATPDVAAERRRGLPA